MIFNIKRKISKNRDDKFFDNDNNNDNIYDDRKNMIMMILK